MEQSDLSSHDASAHSLNKKDTINTDKNDRQQNKLLNKSIEKGRQTRFHYERVLNLDYCLMIFSLINICLSILYSDASRGERKQYIDFFLYFILASLVIQISITIVRYFAQIQLEKSQKILDNQQNLITSSKIIPLIMEILLLFMQPYPFFEDITVQMVNSYDRFTFQFKLNDILIIMGFCKLYIILRVILTNTVYMSPRSSRLCRMYGCQSNYLYSIKCLFKDSPLLLIGIVFISSILIFSLSIRIAERDVFLYAGKLNPSLLIDQQGVTKNDLSDFADALWFTIITMTTVGYGDYFPRTTFGRLIDIILVVWGTFIVSLMVVVLTNTLNMDQSQKRALIVLNRLQAKKTLKQAAALLITHACKKYLLKKRLKTKMYPPLTRQQECRLQNTFFKYLNNFQSVHRTIRAMYEIDDVYEQMTRQFQFINDQISFLLGSQKQTIQNLQIYLNGHNLINSSMKKQKQER